MLYTWLLIVALAAGSAYASDDTDCCSTEDKKEVAFMWHSVWKSGYTDRKVKIMREVWHDLVSKHPEALDLMKKAGVASEDTPEFRAYMVRVVHGLDNIINLLDEPLVLEEQAHFMADKYGAKVGLKKTYFEAVIDSLQSVLPKLSSCFNIGAWNRCLNRLAITVSEKVAAAK